MALPMPMKELMKRVAELEARIERLESKELAKKLTLPHELFDCDSQKRKRGRPRKLDAG